MKSKIILYISILFPFVLCFAQEHPNILWITFEDTSPQFIGAYGNKDARTPNIDKLATEGIMFNNAFSTGTVCSPSRTAIITGVKTYKTGTGNHRSKYTIPNYMKGFPYYLKKLGYYTSNNHKTDYNVANEKEFIKEAWHESSNQAGWWNRKYGQPFFSVFNFMESHQSRVMTKPYDWYLENVLYQLPKSDRIAEDAFEMPPFYNDSKPMRKQFARLYNSIELADIRIGKLLDKLEKDGLRDNTIIFLYADHGEGIPRGKTNGINLGYRVPFIVWFPDKYKYLIPFKGKGQKVDDLVDFTDLAPTVIDLAGGKAPSYMKGHNIFDSKSNAQKKLLYLSSDRSDNGIDMVRTVTDGRWLYSRNFMPYMPEARYIRYMEIGDIKQQMRSDLANGKLNAVQRSIFEPRPPEFLFDIEHDIWELNNLADNPEFKKELLKMRKSLDDNILNSKDVHFLPEYEIRKISKRGNAYDYRMDPKKYDIKAIYNAASLSGFRTAEVTRKQIALLRDKNDIVRYWAVMGLKNQPKTLLHDYEEDLIMALNDTYEPVVVTASAILYDVFNNKKAEIKLKEFVKSSNPDLALMAINYLLYVQDKSPFIETVTTVSRLKRSYDVKSSAMDFLGSLGLVPNTSD